MFTGIIEATARVLEKTRSTLTIERPRIFTDLKAGSSIAVSGVCLTVTKLTSAAMLFDVVPETLKRTKIGSLNVGDRVNLERALKVGERFEGHIVLGHVDGIGRVEKVVHPTSLGSAELRGAGGHVLTIIYPKALRGLIVEKGSIAVDGVSLTIVSATKESFTVALIPHTLKMTTFGELEKWDRARRGAVSPRRSEAKPGGRNRVNIETDVVGRYVLRKA